MNRRHFLMGTAIIAGNAVVRGVQSPNDTVRVGIAGLGGRGSAHVSAWAAMKNVQIAGLCDVDEGHVGDKMGVLYVKGTQPTDGVHGLPPDAREQGYRRRVDCHAESLAHAVGYLGQRGR